MTTGVSIYLVSACTTGEEFVAAFRRYADRGSLFVPIAEPVPVGRRGRFAVTLAGGGVLIEGEAEVISSSKTPSVLHGRIGMTLRFGDLDEASKTVLIELEKARLAAKPAAPSVPPRVVELPAGPRPVPPQVSARIDASVALAECTALGDIEALDKAATPPKAGPKFVMPSVLPVGAPRPKTPTAEMRPRTPSGPQPVVRPKTPSVPPPMPAMAPLPKSPSGPVKVPTQESKPVSAFSATMPAVQLEDGPKTTTMDVPPAPLTPRSLAAMDGVEGRMTPTEMAAVPTPSDVGVTTKSKTPEWMLSTVRGTAPPGVQVPAPPVIGRPAVKPLEPDLDEPTDLTTMPVIPDDTSRKTSMGISAIQREPARPPTPPPVETRHTVLGVPPLSREPAAPSLDDSRHTSLGAPPLAKPPEIDPDDAPVEIDDVDTSAVEVQPPTVATALAKQKPTVEEPTPSGDWTITPRKPEKDELAPVEQAPEETIAPPPTRITGNWTIQLDSSSPDGWSEPSKIDVKPLPEPEKPKKKERTKPVPETPPELRPVARSIIMEALPPAPAEKVTPSDEPKIQIDPTLMDGPIVDPDHGASASPATLSALMPAMAPAPVAAEPRLATPVPGSMAPVMPVARPTPTPLGIDPRVTPAPGTAMPPFPVSPAELVALPTPVPGRLVTDGGVGFFRDSGEVANLAGSGSFPVGDSTSLVEARRRKRLVVIGISAAIAVVLGIVLVIVLLGDGKKADDAIATPSPADAAAQQVVVVAPPDAAEVAPPPPPDAAAIPPPAATCSVDISSVPTGAEVLEQGSKDVLGTTPVKLAFPCGAEAKLVVRKARFGNVLRNVMPTEEGAKLRVALQKLMFSVKVSSTPAGASISVGGKTVAVTPTTMKLPAFEASKVTFSKPGYNVESQSFTPKQNNQTVHANLKKKK